MYLVDLIQLAALIIAGYMFGFWLLSVALRDASIVDLGWGMGFVIVAWVTWFMFMADYTSLRSMVLLALVTVWGLRLTIYLAHRNIGQPEDRRYVAMRNKIGPNFWWVSLFSVFALQGLVMWIVSLPIVVGIESSYWNPELTLVNYSGIAFWVVGMFFEAVGDWQMARFQANPENHGKVCDQGLWRYTRHPNYFGDFCVWWGHWLVSLSPEYDSYSAITILSPVLMTVFLMKFSGVGLLESTIGSRRPDYADYKRRTSAFFPWPPKSMSDR